MMKKYVRITHRPTGTKLAEGPLGWGITPFEGNLYISRKYLLIGGYKPRWDYYPLTMLSEILNMSHEELINLHKDQPDLVEKMIDKAEEQYVHTT